MATSSEDIPRVVIFPPLVPLFTVLLSVFLQLFYPLHVLAQLSIYLRASLGAVLLVSGIGLLVNGRYALTSHGTNVPPSLPILVLVESGIYSWTRNPLYVGGCVAMFGVAILGALDWLPLIFPFSLVVLHFGIIRREEHYLERKFGEAYLRYASRVPRYLPLLPTLGRTERDCTAVPLNPHMDRMHSRQDEEATPD